MYTCMSSPETSGPRESPELTHRGDAHRLGAKLRDLHDGVARLGRAGLGQDEDRPARLPRLSFGSSAIERRIGMTRTRVGPDQARRAPGCAGRCRAGRPPAARRPAAPGDRRRRRCGCGRRPGGSWRGRRHRGGGGGAGDRARGVAAAAGGAGATARWRRRWRRSGGGAGGAGGTAVAQSTSLRCRWTAMSSRSEPAGLTHRLAGYSRSSRRIAAIAAAASPD